MVSLPKVLCVTGLPTQGRGGVTVERQAVDRTGQQAIHLGEQMCLCGGLRQREDTWKEDQMEQITNWL
jgi:hypothetical protein